jgi:hypothetical protein
MFPFERPKDVGPHPKNASIVPATTPVSSSEAKMLEIKQAINAGQVNSGSTSKCLKTQLFSSQVNSRQSTPHPF